MPFDSSPIDRCQYFAIDTFQIKKVLALNLLTLQLILVLVFFTKSLFSSIIGKFPSIILYFQQHACLIFTDHTHFYLYMNMKSLELYCRIHSASDIEIQRKQIFKVENKKFLINTIHFSFLLFI